MDFDFGEDGDAGDRETVNRHAERGHKVYPGSGPRRENPTPACLFLITAEPKVTGGAQLQSGMRCVYEMSSSFLPCPPGPYIDRPGPRDRSSRLQIRVQ